MNNLKYDVEKFPSTKTIYFRRKVIYDFCHLLSFFSPFHIEIFKSSHGF